MKTTNCIGFEEIDNTLYDIILIVLMFATLGISLIIANPKMKNLERSYVPFGGYRTIQIWMHGKK